MRRVMQGAIGGCVWGWSVVASAQPEDLEVMVDAPGEQKAMQEASGAQSLDPGQAQARGALALPDFFAQNAALAVTAGNAGLGGAPNKLNLAARGVNPRFSSRTQLLFDGMPLALAPYGRPQLTMLGVTPLWMDAMKIDLNGSAAHMGPHASGGHLQLSLFDLPKGHREQLGFRIQHTGQMAGDILVQVADERTQWAIGYQNMLGSGYRERSRVNAHGGFARWRRRIGQRHRLGLLLMGYGEDTQIPGGITPAQFAMNPRMSARPMDRFAGARVAGGVFWDAVLRPGFWLRTQVTGGLADRKSEVSTQTLDAAWVAPLRVSPRRFGYLQLQSRLRAQLGELGEAWGMKTSLDVGIAPTVEGARLRSQEHSPVSGERLKLRFDDRASIFATALFARILLQDKKHRWRWSGGIRGEWVGLERSTQAGSLGRHRLFALLPSTDLRVVLMPGLWVFGSYGQTFSPPQFLQIGLASEQKQLAPERGHSAEAGARISLLDRRLRAGVTGFYKEIRNYADVSAERLDQPGRLRALGLESQARLSWPLSRGLRAQGELGHTWTRGRVVGGPFDRIVLPWVAPHRLRASAHMSWERLWGLFVRAGLRHDQGFSTDYRPGPQEDAKGSRGQIPAWTTLWASLGAAKVKLGPSWRGQVSLSVENLLDQRQYTRTPDRNAGRLMLPPRTFALSLRLTHQGARSAAP